MLQRCSSKYGLDFLTVSTSSPIVSLGVKVDCKSGLPVGALCSVQPGGKGAGWPKNLYVDLSIVNSETLRRINVYFSTLSGDRFPPWAWFCGDSNKVN